MIKVENLTKRYAGVTAVDGISFEVGKGEIVGFLGPNGAGKSTTMRMLSCYLPPTSGRAEIAGYDIFNDSLRARERIGYMPESVPLYNDMRVIEYLKYRAALKGDCHLHSLWSDGGATIEAMARTARGLGHDYMVLTDHSPRLTVAHGLSKERLDQQLADVATLNEKMAPFRILTGIEVDILEDGTLDHTDEVLSQLDVVVASVHSKLRMERAAMTERMVRAVASPHVDILGHCTGRKVKGFGPDQQVVRNQATFDAEIAPFRLGMPYSLN